MPRRPRPADGDPRPETNEQRTIWIGVYRLRSTPEQREKWRAKYAANKERHRDNVKAYRQRNPKLASWWKREARRRAAAEQEAQS